MNILEILYTREFKNISYNVRKIMIDAKKLLLVGPRGSGKSTMLFDYLSTRRRGSFLYIDFDDFRLKDVDFLDKLESFIVEKDITLLVMDNFDFSFDVPFCKEIIISTCKLQTLDGFTLLKIYPLDFEEYISFDKRELNIESLFSSFVTNGTFPALFGQHRGDFVKLYQEYLKCFAKDEQQMRILTLLSSNQATVVSIHAMFSKIKEQIKISKDTFYAYTQKLQDEQVIFLVEKFNSPRSSKKLYLIDFAIRSALTFDKDFIKRFENIIFLELLKKQTKLFYTDVIDFYISDENKAILSMPFLPQNLIEDKLKRFSSHFEKLEIKIVLVVTMEVEFEYEQNGIIYEMIPFFNFATL